MQGEGGQRWQYAHLAHRQQREKGAQRATLSEDTESRRGRKNSEPSTGAWLKSHKEEKMSPSGRRWFCKC